MVLGILTACTELDNKIPFKVSKILISRYFFRMRRCMSCLKLSLEYGNAVNNIKWKVWYWEWRKCISNTTYPIMMMRRRNKARSGTKNFIHNSMRKSCLILRWYRRKHLITKKERPLSALKHFPYFLPVFEFIRKGTMETILLVHSIKIYHSIKYWHSGILTLGITCIKCL